MRRTAGTSLLALALVASAALGAQQSPVPVDTIAEARRLRDAGSHGAAAALLAPYVSAHPDDPGTARMAALMAYWSKDIVTARATYEFALERHPNDADLRVELARFLVETGHTSRARQVIAPVAATGSRDLSSTRQAIALMATLNYWRGDFSAARRQFIDALRLDSTDDNSRRQLREVELAAATWIRAGASGWHDDQPLNRATVELEGGWFASPVTPLGVRFGSTRFSHDEVSETVSRAEGTFATFLAGPGLDVSASGGMLNRTFGRESADWTARGALGLRLPAHVVLEGSFERAPYTSTTASLVSPIMTRTVAATLRWRAPSGWMGDATAGRETFEDDNDITTGYVWLLAPIVRRAGGDVQLGYSFAAQAAQHSRFLPLETLNLPPGQTSGSVGGYYNPYYTPRDLRAHSALFAASARPRTRWSVTANGSLGIHVRDDAPVLFAVRSPPNASIVRAYYPREFTPWNLRGAVEGSATDAVRMALTAEHGKGAYYAFTTVGVRLTYSFVAAARRRADRY